MTRTQNAMKLIAATDLPMSCMGEKASNSSFGSGWRSTFLVGIIGLLIVVAKPAYAVEPTISAGTKHTLALQSDGTVVAWGSDEFGQLGVGRATYSPVPLLVDGITGVKSIGAGQKHVLTVKADGTVWSWGGNESSQLGDGTSIDRAAPVRVLSISNAVAVAGGWWHSIALKQDGTVWAWGSDPYSWGQLGDGKRVSSTVPVQCLGVDSITSVAVGPLHNIALRKDGTVWSWGRNQYGQLGVGSTSDAYSPVQVPGLADVVAIGAGWFSGFALKRDGTVWEWGYVAQKNVSRLTPVQTQGISDVISINAGNYHVIATKADGTVWYWDAGSAPAQLAGASGLQRSALGHDHSLLLKFDGSILAFGRNETGQLGDGSIVGHDAPLPVRSLSSIVSVAAGDYHSLALDSQGRVWTWGSDSNGQLARSTALLRPAPSQISGLSDVTALSAGTEHSLALTQDGRVWSWGNGRNGQLGDGSTTNHAVPAIVSDITGVVAISAGASHSLAVKADGRVWAWGDNYLGQLGDATSFDRMKPVQLTKISGVTAVSASRHTLALKSDGTVWAWGSNAYGELGLGFVTPIGSTNSDVNATPKQVPGLSNIKAVATSLFVSLAVGADGRVWAWGQGEGGLLGNGTSLSSSVPIVIDGLSDVVAVSISNIGVGGHALAYKSDGSVWGWGRNSYGELGSQTLDINSNIKPFKISEAKNTIRMSAGYRFSAFLGRDGSVQMSGLNGVGQLGDATLVSRSIPTLSVNTSATAPLDLSPEVPNTIDPALLPSYFLSTSKIDQSLGATLTDLRAGGFNGSVYFTALVPKGSAVVQQSNSFASGGTASICFNGGRTGAKQGPQTPCTPVASGAGVLSTGNTFTAYTDASVDPLQGTNAIVCMGITLPELSAKGQVLVRAIASGDTPTGVAQCPTIQTEATTRLYRASATGGISNLTMDAVVTPQPEDRGQVRKLYSWAIAPDGRQLMQSETQGWVLMQEPMDQALTLTVPTQGDVTLPIVRGVNLSGAAGTLVYVGLGSSWEEVKQLNKAGHYYTIE